MKHTQYNFFPEPYNLYGPFFKERYAHISYPTVKLDIIIYSLLKKCDIERRTVKHARNKIGSVKKLLVRNIILPIPCSSLYDSLEK